MNMSIIATIEDVETAMNNLKATMREDPSLAMTMGKKFAKAVENLTPKDDVTKLLNQAIGYGENAWAKNVLNGNLEGCTKDNKQQKIREHILRSDAYSRLISDPKTRGKAEKWIADNYPDMSTHHAA